MEKVFDNVDIIVDATGTYGNHNWLGDGGLPALGERKLCNDKDVLYNIPDVINNRDKFAGTSSNPK